MELRLRRRKPGETLSALHQDIRKLMAMAHPTLPQEARESIACDYYIDALDDDKFGLNVRERAPASLDEALRVSLQLEAWLKGACKKLDDSVRIRQKVRGSVQPAAWSGSSSSHLDERFSQLEANINKRMDEFLDRAQKSLSALQVQPTSDHSASTAAVNDRGATISDSRHFAPHVFKPVGEQHAPVSASVPRQVWSRNHDSPRRARPPIVCWRCGLPGHLQRNCTQPTTAPSGKKVSRGSQAADRDDV